MILFLHDDLHQLAKELLGLTIKPDVKLREGKNHIKKKDMHVGFGTLRELQS